ncbi:hypothetical protein [Streptomyces hoynatensis]|uniref:F5/8 type C domain-containing protein n=1 Tax=Streptomyces hoynatensis TaxID=1141874 RepID=A0A3A9YR71_9ACTN|nr:hypothetical protein [Streptomyces hoynatensis]RKN38508.1 hypothetical protein D7294_23820 [Streptomyces hoynatensis]
MHRRTKVLAGAGAAALLVTSLAGAAFAGEWGGRGGGPGHHSVVALSAPGRVAAAPPLPCLSSSFGVGLTNTSDEPVFADLDLAVEAPLSLSRRVLSTYLPAADAGYTAGAEVEVRMPRDTAPGSYLATLSLDGEPAQRITVEVAPLPERGPDANLALGEQAYASSTHSNVRLCGGVDGNTDSAQWGASGTHDATSGVFPDTYGVNLAESATVGRVELYTLDSARYPAARMGLRDVDIQVHTAEGWRTVEEVRGNEAGHITAAFAPVLADRVQVVTYDSNDHKYSRIVELEVYAS